MGFYMYSVEMYVRCVIVPVLVHIPTCVLHQYTGCLQHQRLRELHIQTPTEQKVLQKKIIYMCVLYMCPHLESVVHI